MKRILVFVAITLVVAASAIAAEGPHHGEGDGAELGHYLQLTADQRAAWDSAHAEFQSTFGPLRQKHRELGSQIEASLKSSSVDACAVGNQMIAAQAVNNQLRAAKDTLTQKQLSVLTPEQKTKYDAFVAARGEGETKMILRRP